MQKTKKINLFSLGKFQAVMGGLLGVFCGILYAFGGLLIDLLVSLEWISSTETIGLSHGTLLAFGALVAIPLLFSMAGFLLGLIQGLIFNIFAHWFGGFNIEIK
ncbi:MAG: hypothetical protein VW127_04055 [Flavobacteriaceae bacterium]|jgi:hypothetical protein